MNNTDAATDSIVLERVFDAPIWLIWEMWTDPEHFAAWYGPAGARVSVIEMDVRVGGVRRIMMDISTPNGLMQMWFTGEHLAVAAPSRLVYSESMCDAEGAILDPAQMGLPGSHPTTTEVMIQLTDLDGRTRMIMTHAGIPAGSPGETGWTMAFDKLQTRVTERTS